MTDLDELMSRDPLELSSQDIDQIIAHHRNQRVRKASGEKAAKPAIDISAITKKLTAAPPSEPIKRRI